MFNKPKPSMPLPSPSIVILFLFFLFPLHFTPNPASAENLASLAGNIGNRDAIIIADEAGKILVAKNETKPLVPASILKVVTSLTAYHYLGKDFSFKTEFYLDPEENLKIKGYGDPLLVSEVVDKICARLASILKPEKSAIRSLILDDSYFAQPLTIPGISSSMEPYDAPNGALCVNFNTVYFMKAPQSNTYISAEPQTPMLPLALERIKKSGLKKGRIVLSHNKNEILMYAGALFRYFLEQNGVDIHGPVMPGKVNRNTDTLVFTYQSEFSLDQTVQRLLQYSNNFIANQLLITAGARAFDPPGNLDKAVRAATAYSGQVLKIQNFQLSEGSGISRENRISAKEMIVALRAFAPHRHLMQSKDNVFYKTGTLRGISTLAGFVENKHGGLSPFVIMYNSGGKSALSLLPKLSALVK